MICWYLILVYIIFELYLKYTLSKKDNLDFFYNVLYKKKYNLPKLPLKMYDIKKNGFSIFHGGGVQKFIDQNMTCELLIKLTLKYIKLTLFTIKTLHNYVND